jgi:class 3 adenylate cyclase
MTAAAAEQGGMVQLHAYNAIRAYFGVPARRDDDLERTAVAALRMVAAAEQYADAVAKSWNVEAIHVRVGIESAEGTTGGAVGNVVGAAAALQAAAEPDAIVVGQAAASALAARFALQPLGTVAGDGGGPPLAAWRLTGHHAPVPGS